MSAEQLRPVEPRGEPARASETRVPARTRQLQRYLPAILIGVGALGAGLMVALRPTPVKKTVEILPPLVRVLVVESKDLRLSVRTQGTVAPRTESGLVAEVAGRITWISPALVAGGFFEADEPLLRLDPRDYDVALERTRAQLVQRRSEARLAQRGFERRQKLFDQGVASDAARDEAQSAAAVARASVRVAEAAVQQAELDRERAEIRAPYDGRVRSADVDVGRYVTRGVPLATVYAVDYAEVRLPIPDEDLAPLGLAVDFEADGLATGAPVTLTAGLGGRSFSWAARVMRTEGELDPRTRMVTVVAQVDDPYGRRGASHEAPLPVGLFVEARIDGRQVEDAIVLPRTALRGTNQVLVVDVEDRLRFRDVSVARRDRGQVVVAGGLEPGERVLLSRLEAVTDGMRVRVAGTPGAGG
jgi:RND family efflux transporter MFP subunit